MKSGPAFSEASSRVTPNELPVTVVVPVNDIFVDSRFKFVSPTSRLGVPLLFASTSNVTLLVCVFLFLNPNAATLEPPLFLKSMCPRSLPSATILSEVKSIPLCLNVMLATVSTVPTLSVFCISRFLVPLAPIVTSPKVTSELVATA